MIKYVPNPSVKIAPPLPCKVPEGTLWSPKYGVPIEAGGSKTASQRMKSAVKNAFEGFSLYIEGIRKAAAPPQVH